MTRILKMLGAVVFVVAALALMGPAAWSTDALAQGASPPASQPQGQASEGATVEGKIAKVSGGKATPPPPAARPPPPPPPRPPRRPRRRGGGEGGGGGGGRKGGGGGGGGAPAGRGERGRGPGGGRVPLA